MQKQVITTLTSWRQLFCNAFWHGNQDGGDVTSCCAVTTRWHHRKQTALIADSTWDIWIVYIYYIYKSRSVGSIVVTTCHKRTKVEVQIQTSWVIVCGKVRWIKMMPEFHYNVSMSQETMPVIYRSLTYICLYETHIRTYRYVCIYVYAH